MVDDGKFGKALYFDGNDNCVEVEDSDSLNPEEQISIVMWVYPDDGQNCDGGNNWRFLVSKGGWGSYHPSGLQFVAGDGSVHFISRQIDMYLFCALATIDGGAHLGFNPAIRWAETRASIP